MQHEPHLFERTLPLFLAIVTAIVVVFQSQLTMRLSSEIAELKSQITAVKPETRTTGGVRPFAALEQQCTSCHSERRFMGMHGSASELENVVRHMESMPGAHLTPSDKDVIHGSLRLLQCTRCHDESVFQSLAALNIREQRATIERMTAKSGTAASEDEIQAIQRGFQSIQGF